MGIKTLSIVKAGIPNTSSPTTHIVYAKSLALLHSITGFKHAILARLICYASSLRPTQLCIRASAICVMAFLIWK